MDLLNSRNEWMRSRFQNMRSWHHRILARFLRKRGWVVFYLEDVSRECKGTCWLNLYQEEIGRDKS